MDIENRLCKTCKNEARERGAYCRKCSSKKKSAWVKMRKAQDPEFRKRYNGSTTRYIKNRRKHDPEFRQRMADSAKRSLLNRFGGDKEKVNRYYRDYMKRWGHKLRCETINAYGSRCVCCGETNIYFLTIDHKNNDGIEHKRQLKVKLGGRQSYGKLKKQGFPQNLGLQVMCFNCNIGRATLGKCPHKLRKK